MRFRLQKKVSPPHERKSHNGISDGKNVFLTDESTIERAQPNVKDDKWRSAWKHRHTLKMRTNRTCRLFSSLKKSTNRETIDGIVHRKPIFWFIIYINIAHF